MSNLAFQHNVWMRSSHLRPVLAVLFAAAALVAPGAAQAAWKTDAWGEKFKYGAYSTLVSSYLMGTKYADLTRELSNPKADLEKLHQGVGELLIDYRNLSEIEVTKAIEFGQGGETTSIFDAQRSAVSSALQNDAFMEKMPETKAVLEPVDNMLRPNGFASAAVQYSTHRGLYNNAFKIPQNSPASIVNAYISGIRNVEFDVLESRDNVNLIIHDLVTNRLDGTFSAPPKYVRKWDAVPVLSTPEDILNPLGPTQGVEDTGIQNLLTTERFLKVVNATTEGMTLYADARNYASVSLIRLLVEQPTLSENLVVKIYPFEMGGGVTNLLQEYANRYTSGNVQAAGVEIQKLDPNVLVALGGAPNEATEEVTLSTKLGAGAANFGWNEYKSLTAKLPFTTDSGLNYKKFEGRDVFLPAELEAIEAKTFLYTRWLMDFAALGRVRVFQTALLPSLTLVIDENRRKTFHDMGPPDKILSAVNDNFVAIYKLVMAKDDPIVIRLKRPSGDEVSLAQRWAGAGFGTSDRYPDYQFALREGDGEINQGSLRDFYYSMLGAVYQKDDFYAVQMRSAKAIMQQIADTEKQGLPFRYVTTDLPEDLRAGAMGLFGTAWPEEMLFKPGGMIKAKFNPPNIGKYRPPPWTANLFGKLRETRDPQFALDLKAISDLVGRRDRAQKGLIRLTAYYQAPGVLMDAEAAAAIDKAIPYAGPLEEPLYRKGAKVLEEKVQLLLPDIAEREKKFGEAYGVNWDGTPVGLGRRARRDPARVGVPDGNWDH